MRIARWMVMCAAVSFLNVSAFAQTGQEAAPAAPPPAKPADTHVDQDGAISELNLESPTLEDVLDLLHRADPTFQPVVIRAPGVAPDSPPLPSLRLKRVKPDQVVRLIEEIFPITHDVISGGAADITLIRVQNPERPPGTGDTPVYTRVFRLAEAIGSLITTRAGADKPTTPADQEAALNQVLSLIKATLAQVDDASGISPVVQVHNETRTLIVKGTSSQLRAVEDALSALNPNRDRTAHHGLFDSADPLAGYNAAQMQNSQTAEQAANNNNEVRQLKDKLNSVEARLRKVQNAAADRAAEIARLKAALGEKPKGATQGGAKE